MAKIEAKASLKGARAAQQKLGRWIVAVRPSGGMTKALKEMSVPMFRFVLAKTHVDTTALRSARLIKINFKELIATIFTNKSVRNPRTGKKPAFYDVFEQMKGGSHATYDRAIDEIGPAVLVLGTSIVAREL